MTGLAPEERLATHKAGFMTTSVVKRIGGETLWHPSFAEVLRATEPDAVQFSVDIVVLRVSASITRWIESFHRTFGFDFKFPTRANILSSL